MARFSTLIFFLCAFFALNSAAQSGVKSSGCVKNGKAYHPGEKFTVPGVCSQYTCQQGGAISAVTCPLAKFPKGSPCHFSAIDLSKNYPNCCPRQVCPPGHKP